MLRQYAGHMHNVEGYRLPKLPIKAKAKSDHLGFREPGHQSAVDRFERLDAKIESIQDEEAELRKKYDEVTRKCREDIDIMLRQLPQPDSSDQNGWTLKARSLFDEIQYALSKAALTDDPNRESAELIQVRRKLKKKMERIEMEKETLWYYDRSMGKLQKKLEKLNMKPGEDEIRGSLTWGVPSNNNNNKATNESKINYNNINGIKDINSIDGINTGTNSINNTRDGEVETEDNDDRHHSSGYDKNKAKDTTHNRGHGGANGDVSRNQSEKEMKIQIRQRAIVQSMQVLQSDMDQKKQELQVLQADVKFLERDEKELVEKRKQDDGEKEESDGEEQERLDKVAEWSEQKKRTDKLRQMQKDLGNWEHKVLFRELRKKTILTKSMGKLNSDESEPDDEPDENKEQSLCRKLQKLLQDAKTLEDLITKVRRLRDKVGRLRDLRTALGWERDREDRWLQQIGQRGAGPAATAMVMTAMTATAATATTTTTKTTTTTAMPMVTGGAATAASTREETQEVGTPTEERDHFTSNPLQNSRVYKPLKGGEIRLLLLMPSPKECADYPLICALETRSWREAGAAPRYAALSYHWGPESDNGRLYLLRDADRPATSMASAVLAAEDHHRHQVYEDDWGSVVRRALRVPIRDNLFRALLRLRKHDGPVALWVDYLCIDQANEEEKAQQLKTMIKIYRDASNVCVWLGEGDDDGRSMRAMKFIPTIMDFGVLDRHVKDRHQARNWHALAELMRDKWFSRRWVVQEISLARSATVHCGAESVYWNDFADAVSLLASNQDTIKDLFDYSQWREGPNTLGDVRSFGAHVLLEATSKLFLRDAGGGIRMPRATIESLVTSLTTFDTSDRRDLVYSLVYIAQDTSRNSGIYSAASGQHQSFLPDYRKSALEVFIDFTTFCIKSSGSLDIICRPWAMPVARPGTTGNGTEKRGGQDEGGGGRRRRIEENSVKMPSWIPLLCDSEYGAPAEAYSGRKNGSGLVGPAGQQPWYSASARKRYQETMTVRSTDHRGRGGKNDRNSSSQSSIFATGYKLARISAVSARNTGGVILKESLQMGSWTGIQNNDSVPDRIWRTLVADRDPDGQIPPTWYQRACMRCLEMADTFNNGDLNVGELLQDHSEMLRKYLTRVRNVTWNRTFFNATMNRPTEYGGDGSGGGYEGNVNNNDDDDDDDDYSHDHGHFHDHDDHNYRHNHEDPDNEQSEYYFSILDGPDSDSDSAEAAAKGSNEVAYELSTSRNLDNEKGEDADEEEEEKVKRKEIKDDKDEVVENSSASTAMMNGHDAQGRHSDGSQEATSGGGSNIKEAIATTSTWTTSKHAMTTDDDTNLFGLGPPQSRKGDFVCILYGCSVPVVLRPVVVRGTRGDSADKTRGESNAGDEGDAKSEDGFEGPYVLVGEAYVHGKMDGEAMGDLRKMRTWGEEEVFELQ